MRKVFRGALVIAISGAMLGGFSACKDTQDDLLYETQLEFTKKLQDQNTALNDLRDAQTAALNDAINQLRNEINSCNCNPQDLVDLNNAINALESKLDDKTGSLGNQIAAINTEVTNLQQALADLTNSLADYATKDELNQLNQEFTTLQAGLSQQIQDAINSALENYATVAQLDSTATAVKAEAKANLDDAVEILRAEDKVIADKLDALIGDYEGTLGDLVEAYKQADQDLQDQIDALSDRLDATEKAIEAVKKQLAKMVTSLVVQGTYNPILGSFTLPTGTQSNILCAYYGETETDIEFPSTQTGNLVDQDSRLSAGDIKLLNETGLESTLSILNGTTLVGDEGNAGKLYVTVNPTAVDFDGLTFDLVNSLDEEAGISLSPLTPSKDKLTFGYSRGEAANGFYEAKATLREENIDKAKLSVNTSALKSAVKDLYKNKQNANFTTILGTLYDLVNDQIDRNAIKASWSVDGEANSVYSQYGIAAFAVKPLSYAFDPSFSLSIPHLPNIPSLDDLNIEFKINTPNFKLDLSGLNLDLNINFDETTIDYKADDIVVSFDIPEFEKDENGNYVVKTDAKGEIVYETKTQTVGLESIVSDLTAEIANAFNSALTDAGASINDAIKDAIENQLASQIENAVAVSLDNTMSDLADNINSQIKSQISSALGSFQSYLDKLQSLFNRVNSIIDRINGGVNINNYLQATLVYQTSSSSFGMMSTSAGNPTIFRVNSGNAITLHPTSYTAEVIAPAYKKFIGVTNVFSNNDATVTAQKGDSKCLEAARTANSQKYVNEVIDGARYAVPFVGEAGYTYEIVYAALDYQGKVSMRKYYVKVI
jgi:predicted  nucleic acid-binding Zn-ribbon protein